MRSPPFVTVEDLAGSNGNSHWKLPSDLAAASNVPAQVGTGVDDLGIGVFEPPLAVRIVDRRPLGEDIADGGIDRTGQQGMGFLQRSDDVRSKSADKGKGTWRLRAFQLHPTPGSKTQKVFAWQLGPSRAHLGPLTNRRFVQRLNDVSIRIGKIKRIAAVPMLLRTFGNRPA